MFFAVSYDIVNNKNRNKVAKTMEDYGTRVQYSVFECNLDKKMLDKMMKEVLQFLNKEEDSLRIYRLCEECVKKIDVYGLGVVTKDGDVIVV